MPPVSASHRELTTFLLVLAGLGVLSLLLLGIWMQMRRTALRSWQKLADEFKGEFKAKNQFQPDAVTGTYKGRPLILETAISMEEETPYFHTRCVMPLRNKAGFILGLRRKSMLEEVQFRNTPSGFDLSSEEFQKRFFVVCNMASHLNNVLNADAAKELLRYADVEVYIRLQTLEWRRAGEISDRKAIKNLTDVLIQFAEAIELLPGTSLTLTEKLADEALLAKGI